MNTKKRNIRIMSILISFLLLSTMLAGCGQEKDASAPSPEKEMGKTEFALSIATPLSAEDQEIYDNLEAVSKNPDKLVWKHANVVGNMLDSPSVRGERQFFIEMKKRLGDKIEFQFFWNGSLGTSSDQILGGLQGRNAESYSYNVGAMAEYTNAFMPLDVMFLIPDLEAGAAISAGPAGQLMREKCLEDTGLNVLVMGAIGMRHMTNSEKPITSVDDIKGMKIRVQNNPLHLLAMNALGASPTPIAYAELFTSLQQGVVDGQENPISNIFAQNYSEVQDYLTITNHLYTAGAFIVNNEWLLEQTPEIQKAVADSAKIAQAYSGPELMKTEQLLLDRLVEEGFEVNELSGDAKAKFRELSMSTWDEAAKKIGVEYFESIRKSIEEMGY